MSALVAKDRTFPLQPPVHVVILPTQLPVDLRTGHCRHINEAEMVCCWYSSWFPSRTQLMHGTQNEGSVPDHMNVIPSDVALELVSVKSPQV
jgi:hypothetical protein